MNYRRAIWHYVEWTDRYVWTERGCSSGRFLAEDW